MYHMVSTIYRLFQEMSQLVNTSIPFHHCCNLWTALISVGLSNECLWSNRNVHSCLVSRWLRPTWYHGAGNTQRIFWGEPHCFTLHPTPYTLHPTISYSVYWSEPQADLRLTMHIGPWAPRDDANRKYLSDWIGFCCGKTRRFFWAGFFVTEKSDILTAFVTWRGSRA